MDREISVIQLANAVQWWMSYTSAVGRSYVLAESSIKFPLAEYLERSNLKEIKLEFSHPKLSSRRFDLHFEDFKDNKTAIEFKFIKNGSTRDTSEKKRVFNDLMRLYLYLDNNEKGYFLICGAQQDFSKDFYRLLSKPPKSTEENPYITPDTEVKKSLKTEPEGFYSKWFSFDNEDPDIEIAPTVGEDEYGKIYKSFLSEYGEIFKETTGNELHLPEKFKTRLLFLSQEIEHENEFYQPANIGIWEVTKE
jgi:hypothetical protein